MELREVIKSKTVEPSQSTYQGEIGEKIKRKVVVVSIRVFGGLYGSQNIYTFEDENGNIYTWFTKTENFDEKEEVFITATVKDHSEYNDVLQTIVTRVKRV